MTDTVWIQNFPPLHPEEFRRELGKRIRVGYCAIHLHQSLLECHNCALFGHPKWVCPYEMAVTDPRLYEDMPHPKLVLGFEAHCQGLRTLVDPRVMDYFLAVFKRTGRSLTNQVKPGCLVFVQDTNPPGLRSMAIPFDEGCRVWKEINRYMVDKLGENKMRRERLMALYTLRFGPSGQSNFKLYRRMLERSGINVPAFRKEPSRWSAPTTVWTSF